MAAADLMVVSVCGLIIGGSWAYHSQFYSWLAKASDAVLAAVFSSVFVWLAMTLVAHGLAYSTLILLVWFTTCFHLGALVTVLVGAAMVGRPNG